MSSVPAQDRATFSTDGASVTVIVMLLCVIVTVTKLSPHENMSTLHNDSIDPRDQIKNLFAVHLFDMEIGRLYLFSLYLLVFQGL